MIRQRVTINNLSGLHLRPAGVLSNEAIKYRASVEIDFCNARVNAKSILSILGACIRYGDEIEVICDGTDEQDALQNVLRVINDGLGE